MVADTRFQKQERTPARPARPGCDCAFPPGVDIIEKSDELLVLVDVPGINADDIDVACEAGLLTIHAKAAGRRDDGRDYLIRERRGRDFRRSFRIGDGVDTGGIEAGVKRGVLTLRLPKADAVKRKKIAVTAA